MPPSIWKKIFAFVLALLSLANVQAGTLVFSAPHHLATLPWAKDSNPGVPAQGAGWLVVDTQGRFWLETDRDFNLFSPQGRYLQTVLPMDRNLNFYGFAAMASRPGGGLALLERLETPSELFEKFNVELRSKPGSKLILLTTDGKVESQKIEVDPAQPHSAYDLEQGQVIAFHSDGTFRTMDSFTPGLKESAFNNLAAVFNPALWTQHIRKLPLFISKDRYYHDVFGRLYTDKNSESFLMGSLFVEGLGALGERKGRIYYRFAGKTKWGFSDEVFVEDPKTKSYAIIAPVAPNKDLNIPKDHAFYLDPKGNLIEGVAEKDGYRIYEWRRLN